MRILQGRPLGVALLALLTLLSVAHCLSIHAGKRAHHHALRHVGDDAAHSALSERTTGAATSFSIELINNLDDNDIHAYIVTNAPTTDQAILITADGEEYHPVAYNKGQATPIPAEANCGISLGGKGSSIKISMPVSMQKGRVYVAKGELAIVVLQADQGITLQMPAFQSSDNSKSFGFVEANQADACMWANPTYVDFVGLPLSMELVLPEYTANASGVPADGIQKICQMLQEEQKKDGYPWGDLCLKDSAGEAFRVLSPQHMADGFSKYFDDYIDQVWDNIEKHGIQFDLQDNTPVVNCTASGESMFCDRVPGKAFPKPSSADVWGCSSGPFAQTTDPCYNYIGARFCAAFHRATLLLEGGGVQPRQSIDKYYPLDWAHNKYARIVHEVQSDHMGYTFPYDDVKPDFKSEVSGLISGDDPSVLRIFVGGKDFGSQQIVASSAAPSSTPVSAATAASTVAPSSSSESTSSSLPSPTPSASTSTEVSSTSSMVLELPTSSTIEATSDWTAGTSESLHAYATDIHTKHGEPPTTPVVTVVATAIVTEVVTQTTTCVSPAAN